MTCTEKRKHAKWATKSLYVYKINFIKLEVTKTCVRAAKVNLRQIKHILWKNPATTLSKPRQYQTLAPTKGVLHELREMANHLPLVKPKLPQIAVGRSNGTWRLTNRQNIKLQRSHRTSACGQTANLRHCQRAALNRRCNYNTPETAETWGQTNQRTHKK